jgi:hypothetical protein
MKKQIVVTVIVALVLAVAVAGLANLDVIGLFKRLHGG